MSPKKQRTRKKSQPQPGPTPASTPTSTATDNDDGGDASPRRTISRTPVVLDDRRRWPLAVWTLLTLTWLLGTVVFFVLFLAEGFAMQTGSSSGDSAIRAAGGYLIGLLCCALLVPLAGTITAAVVRRRIAAILFGLVTLASAGALVPLGFPVDMISALAGAFS